ncbi:MAG TPA: hypothetical protein VF006_17590 [Longimicrobium sp.]
MPNGAFSPVWPGPSLLVPLTLDVLLVGKVDRDSKTAYAQTGTSYYNLFKNQTPDAPAPFANAPAPPLGANLMWTIPFSLRQGVSNEATGTVTFPNVANRWLVLRILYPRDGTAPTLTAGVLQADLLQTLSSAQDPSQYPDPDNQSAVRRLGKWFPLETWNGPGGPAKPFLHAVGPGEVSWSVSFDNVRNVLALNDPLLPTTPATVTYMVNGWYADPASDPLYGLPTDDPQAWQDALRQQFNWSVGDTLQDVLDGEAAWQAWALSRGIDGGSDADLPPQLRDLIGRWKTWRAEHGVLEPQPPLPRQMLCHGMVATVDWQGFDVAYGTGIPGHGLGRAKVAVGSTATEAIAAFMSRLVVDEYGGSERDLFTIQRALEAFQQDLLFDLTTDPVGVESLLHQARFGSVYGGSEWIVVRPDQEDEDAEGFGEHSGQQTIPLDPPQTAALTALNAAQRALDANDARLSTQRGELFALDFKQRNLGRLDPDHPLRVKVETALAAMKGAVQASLDAALSGKVDVEARAESLRGLLNGKYALKQVDLPGYFGPNDPVVMIGGAELDTKLSPPGTYDEEATLYTRFTGQTVRGIEVSWPVNGVELPLTVGVAELLSRVLLPLGTAIPKEAPDLWLEALFLDPSAAPLLASLYFAARGVEHPTQTELDGLTEKIVRQQTALWNAPERVPVTRKALQEAAGFVGDVPSRVAVELRTGQPWTPVFLDWRVQWYPTSMEPAGELAGWTLGEIDYEWDPPFQVPTPPAPLIFQGRTVLNPKVGQGIQAKFAAFEHDPNYDALPVYLRQDLEEVAGLIGGLDLLTQAMAGLTDQLVTRLQAMNRTAADPQVALLLGDSPVSFRPVTGSQSQTVPLPFFPLRSGHLQVLDVWVVDSYGQVLRGKDPNSGATVPIPDPIRAESVFTPNPQGGSNASYLQLAPRISQPARVELRFLQADDDAIASNSSDLTSPICGWVVPNHLDGSLMVFNAGGDNLGAVLPVQRDVDPAHEDSSGLLWEAVPGSQAPLGAPPELPNRHLQAFIDALLAQGLSGSGALEELLDVIDSSLWRVDPFAAQTGNLSVLLGHPLAVVRADVAVRLFGYPDYNQSWGETGRYYINAQGEYAPVAPPFTGVEWKARVGDLRYRTNGVLGYFQGDRYDRFYSAHGAGFQTAPLRRALRRGDRLEAARGVSLLAGRGRVFSTTRVMAGDTTSYVETDHLIPVAPGGDRVLLTLLMDPLGTAPAITGTLPAVEVALSQGPVAQALQKMTATFRMGPLLIDPARVEMPLPGNVKGTWGWVARRDVSTWSDTAPVGVVGPVAGLEDTPRTLTEGWLTLSGAVTARPVS